MTVKDTIALPREVVEQLLKMLEMVEPYADQLTDYSSTAAEWPLNLLPKKVSEAITALRKALAAVPTKHDLMKWAKDAGSSPEDLERFATYTIATRDMEIATLREENEALQRDAERYEWLKAKVEDYDGHACFPQVPYPAPIPDRSPFDAVDAAIDAAMKEGT